MTPSQEDELLARAVARGWLTSIDLERAADAGALDRDTVDLGAAPSTRGPRIERLVRRGLLDEASLRVLLDEQEGGTPAPAAPAPPADVPPSLRGWDRYQVLERLGSGGAGTVYRARDPRLDREVAIKLLHAPAGESPRALAEARAQARVEHDHVCKVFEVGELDGRPYIVMQLVQGVTLARAAARMTLEEKVAVIAEAADAVHAAHRIGLIHRDLKPANILVEEQDGAFKPYVMDFGLARELASGASTANVAGTPPYMAPEQARGDTRSLDRRTDVYGLGATLYDVLTGAPPFGGDSGAAVLLSVIDAEPLSIRRRRPELPRDLETVVAVCLEKDPARRYDSARALADDLRRFLDGEPITARRAGWTYRARKRLKKHRALAAVSALALCAVVVIGAIAVRARLRAGADARAAQRFGQEVSSLESFVRMAALAPLHDTRQERELARARMRAIEAELPALGDAGRAAGHYALGRGHLALGDAARARAALEEAWRLGEQGPQAQLALAQALARLYQEGLAGARGLSPDERRRAEASLRSDLLEPARRAVRRAGGATLLESAGYTEALIDFIDGRFPEAAAGAARAAAEVPWLYEARRLEGEAHLAMARERSERGEYDGALAELEEAGARFAAALAVGRSDPALLRAELGRAMLVLETRGERKGGAVAEDFARVAAAFEAVGRANPDAEGLHGERSAFELKRATWIAEVTGGDALGAVEASLAHALLERQGIAKSQALALAYWMRARVLERRGGDAAAALDEAEAHAEQAVALDATVARSHNLAGVVLRARADAEQRAGRDPLPLLARAIAHYRRVAELDPSFLGVWNNLGRALEVNAAHRLHHGLDATAAVVEVLANGRRVATADPASFIAMNSLGNAFYIAAEAERLAGRDPRPLLALSEIAYARSAVLNPRHPYAPSNLGGSALLAATYERDAGLDPGPQARRALAFHERALAASPDFAASHLGVASALVFLGEPGARAALERARALRPLDDRLPPVAVRVALAEAKQARAPGRALAQAAAEAAAAVARRPGFDDPLVDAAEVALEQARAGLDRPAALARGRDAASRALAVNPRHLRARRILADLEALR